MKRKTKFGFITACLISFIIGAGFIYLVKGQTASTLWVTEGIYPSGVSYSIWRDGNYYFAKNGYGQLMFSGTNFTTVITACLGSDRTIYIKQATYVLNANFPSIELKSLNNVEIIAEHGTIWKKDEPVGYVGQLLEIDGCNNVIVRNIIFDQDKDNPDHLINPSFGLQWIVRVVGNSNYTYFYNCQFINAIQNGLVTGLNSNLLVKDSIFDFAGEHSIYLSLSDHATFDNVDFKNYGKIYRGYLKIGLSKHVSIINSKLNPDEDGLGCNASSYTLVIADNSNSTLLENNQYINPLVTSIEGDFTTIRGGTFENITGASGYTPLWTTSTANFTTIEDVNFINWRWRTMDISLGSDTMLKGCYFSGGTTSFTSNFGLRTSVFENRWNPDATYGIYGFYDATGSGIIDGNHIPNSTLTFLFPSGAINGTNFFY